LIIEIIQPVFERVQWLHNVPSRQGHQTFGSATSRQQKMGPHFTYDGSSGAVCQNAVA